MEAATKADLQETESRLRSEMGEMEGRLRSEITSSVEASEERMKAHFEGQLDAHDVRMEEKLGRMIHDTETRILQAFYGYAEATTKHLTQIDGNMALFFGRLGSLETRMLEVEKRLHIPPA